MTQDEIIHMAREAGIGGINGVLLIELEQSGSPELERFAMLIREACAKVCDELQNQAESIAKCFDAYATECAAAIRARGDK